jgi:hypothetical protein
VASDPVDSLNAALPKSASEPIPNSDHCLPLSVIQLVPGGWEDGHESDTAKQVLLWVRPSPLLFYPTLAHLQSPQFTRIVLGIQVLSTGAILPARFLLRKNVRQTLAVLLGPVMLFQTLVVAGFAKG